MWLTLLALACTSAPDLADSGSVTPPEPTPQWQGPVMLLVNEGETLQASWTPPAPGPVLLDPIPPGAQWEPSTATLTFTPDFTQFGQWELAFTDVEGNTLDHIALNVVDTITPPPPTVSATEPGDGFERLFLDQHTDAFLAGPQAGRDYPAIVTVPTDATADDPVPVRIWLHGYGTTELPSAGWSGEFRIVPSDPDNTYWWGFSDSADGPAPPYTQRRVLALLEWVLRTYPGADPSRVYVQGESMGGAGALLTGLLHSRHIAYTDSRIGQTIAANHRPSRIDQLSWHWGSPSEARDDGTGTLDVWSRQDLTRALADDPGAADQFVFLKHGKDDPTIHFGAVSQPSPLTGLSFYDALQVNHVGHLAVWDEGGHGPLDPVLGASWWQAGWNPIFDDTASLRRGQAFPAFSSSSADDDPGDGTGSEPWSDESGYAADVSIPGDTRWSGDLAGVINRGLRWDATELVDTAERFAIPLRVLSDDGPAPLDGYPPTGDQLSVAPPVLVDVTPRRVQRFQLAAGSSVDWTFGNQSGSVTVAPDGTVTIPALAVTTDWTPLELSRGTSSQR